MGLYSSLFATGDFLEKKSILCNFSGGFEGIFLFISSGSLSLPVIRIRILWKEIPDYLIQYYTPMLHRTLTVTTHHPAPTSVSSRHRCDLGSNEGLISFQISQSYLSHWAWGLIRRKLQEIFPAGSLSASHQDWRHIFVASQSNGIGVDINGIRTVKTVNWK